MRVHSMSIMKGRDRISDVLEPVLGEGLALERANNIAQVLLFCANDPVVVFIVHQFHR